MIVSTEDRERDRVALEEPPEESGRHGQSPAGLGWHEGHAGSSMRDPSVMPDGDPPCLTLWGMDEER